MKITKVTYGETFNTGNYESVRIGMEAEVDARETTEAAVAKLRKAVRDEYRTMLDGGVKFKR